MSQVTAVQLVVFHLVGIWGACPHHLKDPGLWAVNLTCIEADCSTSERLSQITPWPLSSCMTLEEETKAQFPHLKKVT